MKTNLLKGLLLAGVALAGANSMQAVKFYVTLSDISAVGIEIYNSETGDVYEPMPLFPGKNIFNLPEDSDITVWGKGSYKIDVTASNGEPQFVDDNNWYHYITSADEEVEYTVNATNTNDSMSGSFTLNVDDASAINVSFDEYPYRSISFANGENNILYDPENESTLYIRTKDWNRNIYKVTLDGVDVEKQWGDFYVPITEGCYVDVMVNYPELPVDVLFKYSENGEGSVMNVKVNDQPVDFDGSKVTVMLGDKISFEGNPNYKISKITANGNYVYYYEGYPVSKTITEETTFEITAAPYATFPVTVNVSDPAQIKVYLGYSGENVVTLTGTHNVIEVNENDKYIGWKAAEGCKIVSAYVNGELRESSGCSLVEGLVIDISTDEIRLDKSAIVWIDERPEAVNYFDLSNTFNRENNMKNAAAGYTLLPFCDDYNPFTLNFSATGNFNLVGKVYLDGEQLSGSGYYGDYYFKVTFGDRSVLKVFLVNDPVECNVAFDIQNGCEVTVTHDIIAELANPAEGLTCFRGTELRIAPDGNTESISVSVNDAPVLPVDGAYTFVVTDENTAVKITGNLQDSVNTLNAANVAMPVYNLQGMKVANSIDNLPAGIYISNGKKVTVK